MVLMKIMVFDVPADSGGALSILEEFYKKFKLDKENTYVFVLGCGVLKNSENIEVLNFPWIKKSWLHRLFFDYFVAPKLVANRGIDRVLSLQNVMVPRTKIPQTIYVHNALPFSEYRFSIFKNKLLWAHQNVLSRFIFRSIKSATKVIVQTQWMKKKCIDMLDVNPEKIEVLSPDCSLKPHRFYQRPQSGRLAFFYPASGVVFKNHEVIIRACLRLKKLGIFDYDVFFTLSSSDGGYAKTIYSTAIENKLPISFLGSISREEVFGYYEKAILVFPSYIETVGLPLLEARMHATPILASNSDFSQEILSGYDGVSFFSPFDVESLVTLMKNLINGKEK
jgi:glycosyltransferase involved in cell wall biosynthesis